MTDRRRGSKCYHALPRNLLPDASAVATFFGCLPFRNQTAPIIMPTALRLGPYAFVFFSSDGGEPPHIHVKRDTAVAKYWLSPVSLARNAGFRAPELIDVERLVDGHRQLLLEAWHVYFGA